MQLIRGLLGRCVQLLWWSDYLPARMLCRIWTELLHPIFFNRRIILRPFELCHLQLLHVLEPNIFQTATTLGLTVPIKVVPFTLVFSRTTPALPLPMMEKLNSIAEQALNFLSLKNLWFHMTASPVKNQHKLVALTMFTIPTLMTRQTWISPSSLVRPYLQKPETANLKCKFPTPDSR